MTETQTTITPTTRLSFKADLDAQNWPVFYGQRRIGHIQCNIDGFFSFEQPNQTKPVFRATERKQDMEDAIRAAFRAGRLDTTPEFTATERENGIGGNAHALLETLEIELSPLDKVNGCFDPEIHGSESDRQTGTIDKIILDLMGRVEFATLSEFEETGDFDLLDGLAYDAENARIDNENQD